ncbi:hypothetical protein SDC9_174394 [bioreactor metagenome]|uniref:Uncharacterized protein n=1 Tax=bioreactor metagenome TaxID=1076179 RepID=A0A645GJ59_9ZZZZ
MPEIDHEGHQGDRKKACPPGEKTDGHKLHGAGVDKKAHEQGPPDAVSLVFKQHSEGHAHKQVSQHNRDGDGEGRFDRFYLQFAQMHHNFRN